jgi:hypothetical protein
MFSRSTLKHGSLVTHPTLAVIWEWHTGNRDLSGGQVRISAPAWHGDDRDRAIAWGNVVLWDGQVVECVPYEAVDPVVVAARSSIACKRNT